MRAGGAQRFAVMDIAARRTRFDRLGRITRIDLRVRPGCRRRRVRATARGATAAGRRRRRDRRRRVAAGASLSRSYRVNLNVLALVALFTGGLLVFSTQALAVVRRRAQFALLRVLGVTRRRLVRAARRRGRAGRRRRQRARARRGLRAGAGSRCAVVGADLGAGYFRGVAPALALDPWRPRSSSRSASPLAMLGSLVPALEAARAAPALALKAGDEERAFARLRPALAGARVAIGVGAAPPLLPPVAGLPLFGYAAIALLLVGTLMLMPRLAAIAARAAARAARAAPRARARAAARRAGAGCR